MTRRVLLVDDDDDVRLLLRLALEVDGVSTIVGEAANGEEAIRAARDHQPDVIVLDQSMPVMTGTEAIPGLREAAPAARILIYSAYAETGQRALFEALADGVMVKGTPMREVAEFVGATPL